VVFTTIYRPRLRFGQTRTKQVTLLEDLYTFTSEPCRLQRSTRNAAEPERPKKKLTIST